MKHLINECNLYAFRDILTDLYNLVKDADKWLKEFLFGGSNKRKQQVNHPIASTLYFEYVTYFSANFRRKNQLIVVLFNLCILNHFF